MTLRESTTGKWLLAFACAACLQSGCSRHPEVAPDNRRMISSLRTALSTQRADWLAQNVQAIEARRRAGKMSDIEYAAFQSIMNQARQGEWKAAERDAVSFEKAQRPTPEEIERVTKQASQ